MGLFQFVFHKYNEKKQKPADMALHKETDWYLRFGFLNDSESEGLALSEDRGSSDLVLLFDGSL